MAIIGKINDEILLDDAVLRETKQKVVINNQQITDLETFNKVVDSIKEKDKEIEKLNKEKEDLQKRFDCLMEAHKICDEDNDRLNNIIDLVVKDMEMTKYNPELPTYNSCVAVDKDHIQQWIDKLKEGKDNE